MLVFQAARKAVDVNAALVHKHSRRTLWKAVSEVQKSLAQMGVIQHHVDNHFIALHLLFRQGDFVQSVGKFDLVPCMPCLLPCPNGA